LIRGIDDFKGAQATMITMKWVGKQLQISEHYPLKHADGIISNAILRPDIKLKDVEKGGFPEIIIDMGYDKIAELEIFKVQTSHLESLNPKNYQDILSSMGYKNKLY
jgi:hypothetical protein